MSETRDRDAAVEQWLRHPSATDADLAPSEECLDAETMAAWIDKSLAGAARRDAEAHVAGCARCQAIAATIARTEAIADWSAPERRAGRRWLTWVIPVSAAAIVAVVVLVARRDVESPQTQGVSQVAESRPVTPPAEPQSGLRSEPKNESALAKADQQNRAAQAQKPAAAREEDEKKALRDKAAAARSTDTFDAVAPKRPAAAPAAAAPAAGRATNQNAAASQARADESARTAEARLRQAEAVEIDIRTPDPAVRWRIVGARVERSIDAGSSWTPVPTGVTSEVTAGAAPSASVCWLVGRGGLVLLTTNGTAWKRLTFPEPTDLSVIRATDARNATVTTADGREFSTTDGGRTWTRRDLQEIHTTPF